MTTPRRSASWSTLRALSARSTTAQLIGRSENESTASVKRGYVNDTLVRQGVWDGVINPFGDQTAAGTAALEAAQVRADTLIGKNKVDFVERPGFRPICSAPPVAWPPSPSAQSTGVSGRRSRPRRSRPKLGSLGIDPESDTTGSRKSAAVFAELSIPLMKRLDLTLAGRFDKYNDFGNTFNPKVALRYQPIDQAGACAAPSTRASVRRPCTRFISPTR